MKFLSSKKRGSSTILRQSDLGVVTWRLDSQIRKGIRKVQRNAEKLLREHRSGIRNAKGGRLIAEVEAGVRVLEMLCSYRVICTTELHVHRALIACYFAAHFWERGASAEETKEAIGILAQVAPCSLDPSRTYFSAEIVENLSCEAGAVYASLAETAIEDDRIKLTLADALCIYPELCRHGGSRSGPMLAELAAVTEACRDALTRLGGKP